MRTAGLLVVALLGMPSVTWGDAATVAAALPTAAAEVRYLQQLCETTRAEHARYARAVHDGTAARTAGDHAALQKSVAAASVHQRALYRALDDLKSATEVVKAKRGTLPKGAPDPCRVE